jgi:hypothetical protein
MVLSGVRNWNTICNLELLMNKFNLTQFWNVVLYNTQPISETALLCWAIPILWPLFFLIRILSTWNSIGDIGEKMRRENVSTLRNTHKMRLHSRAKRLKKLLLYMKIINFQEVTPNRLIVFYRWFWEHTSSSYKSEMRRAERNFWRCAARGWLSIQL